MLQDHIANLGATAVDTVSNFSGVITHLVIHSNGNIQYSLQPRGKGKKLLDAYSFDHHNVSILEKLDKVISVPIIDLLPGTQVAHKFSDLKGTVKNTFIFSNGCVYCSVLNKELKDGKLNVNSILPAIELNKIHNSEFKNDLMKVLYGKDSPPPVGGPTTKSIRIS